MRSARSSSQRTSSSAVERERVCVCVTVCVPTIMAEGEKQARKHSEESVKLFVGQVPKQMTEAQLLAMFKEFAIVDEVNIIKDKATRASRGSTRALSLFLSLLNSVTFFFFERLDHNARFEHCVEVLLRFLVFE